MSDSVPAASAAPAPMPDEISLEDARAFIDAMPEGAEFNEKGEQSPSDLNEAARKHIAQQPDESPPKAEESDPPKEDPAEETEAKDPEDELPLIDRPRSWAKELDDEWATYPRAAQERIAKREQERDTALRRSQNEAAEQRKALEAERDAIAKMRTEYETQLPLLNQSLEGSLQGQFGDIRNEADVDKLQAEDPFRYLQWQWHQTKLAGAKQRALEAEARQNQEKQSKRASYEAEQTKLLAELVPEMADPKKASELRERAVAMLKDDLGLKDDQLSRWYGDDTGHEILSNSGIQKLIVDGLKYRDLQSAPKAVATKPLPPVVKPGSTSPVSSLDAEIKAAEKRLEQSGSEADGWALLELRAKASARRK